MSKKFVGKVAVVTGAGQGIGRGCALRFAKENANVVIVEINDELAEKVSAEAKELGGQSMVVLANVCKSEQVQEMVSKIIEKFGRIDILVNNVGGRGIVGAAAVPIIELEEKRDWDPVIEITLKTTFLCSKFVAKEMVKRRSGKIVNIASMAGKALGWDKLGAYAPAKAGVIRLTETLGMELARYGINVNAVCPGIVQTPGLDMMFEQFAESEGISIEEARMRKIATIPLGRIEEPDDVAGVVAFLASEDASYMTGQAINVTGGIIRH